MHCKIRPAEFITAFLFGFFLYSGFEIALRDRTHWTMGLLGGAAFTLLYSMAQTLSDPLPVKALLGAVFITAAEYTAGVFDNLIMGWQVWDYSGLAWNLQGQICLLFSCIWFLLCFPALLICGAIFRQYHKST